MSHPAIDPERLAADAAAASIAEPGTPRTSGAAASAPSLDATGSLRARARRLARPLVDRARHELAHAAAIDQAALRTEVAELRAELARARAEHAAVTAALYEELAALTARLDAASTPTAPE